MKKKDLKDIAEMTSEVIREKLLISEYNGYTHVINTSHDVIFVGTKKDCADFLWGVQRIFCKKKS